MVLVHEHLRAPLPVANEATGDISRLEGPSKVACGAVRATDDKRGLLAVLDRVHFVDHLHTVVRHIGVAHVLVGSLLSQAHQRVVTGVRHIAGVQAGHYFELEAVGILVLHLASTTVVCLALEVPPRFLERGEVNNCGDGIGRRNWARFGDGTQKDEGCDQLDELGNLHASCFGIGFRLFSEAGACVRVEDLELCGETGGKLCLYRDAASTITATKAFLFRTNLADATRNFNIHITHVVHDRIGR